MDEKLVKKVLIHLEPSKDQEEKITDFEDRYYKKFSAMETALAKLSSKESAISGLLGM